MFFFWILNVDEKFEREKVRRKGVENGKSK